MNQKSKMCLAALCVGGWSCPARASEWLAAGATGGVVAYGLAVLVVLIVVLWWCDRRRMRLVCRLQQVLPVRLMAFDREGNILYFRREQGAGAVGEESSYRRIDDLPWVNANRLLTEIQAVYDSGKPAVLDGVFYGDKRLVTLARVESTVFGCPAVLAVSSDSNALQDARDAACAEAAHLKAAFHAIGDAVIVVDNEGRITLMNPAAVALTGYAAEEADGRLLEEIFQVIEMPERGGGGYAELIGRDGKRTPIAESSASIRTEEGVSGRVLLFRDATEARSWEDELNLMMTLLRQLAAHGDMGFFRMDIATGESRPLLACSFRSLPRRNGRVLPPGEWIMAEDLKMLEERYRQLVAGEIGELKCVFRSESSGQMRYFELAAVLPEVLKGQPVRMIGVLRDITVEVERESRHDNALGLLRTITESIPYPIFIKDIADDFRYLSCNSTFAQHLGLSPDQVAGHTDFEVLLDAGATEQLRSHDREVVRTGKLMDWMESYATKEGKEFRCHSLKQLIAGEDGRRLLLGISIDVTGEELARRMAQEGEELLRSVLDCLPVNVFAKDAENGYRYLLWNKRMAEQFGRAPETVLGKTDEEVALVPENALEIMNRDRALMEKGEVDCRRQFFRDCHGAEVVCDVYRVPCVIAGRRILLGMGLDVTERHRQEQERVAMIETLERHVRCGRLLNESLRLLTRGDLDLEKNVSGMLELYCRDLQADRGYVYRCTETGVSKDIEWSATGILSLETYSYAEIGSWLPLLEAGEPVIVNDAMNLPEELRASGEMLHAENIKLLLAAPVRREGKLYGFLGFDFITAKRTLSKDDIELLWEAANMYTLARERHDQSQRLHEQDLLQAEMFKQIDVPTVVVDADRVVRAINPMFFQIWPVDSTDMVGKLCYGEGGCKMRGTSYCTPENCIMWRTLRTGRPTSQIRTINGRELQIHSKPVTDGAGKIRYVVESIADVSDIGRERRELAEYVEQDRLIRECLELLAVEQDFSEVCRRVAVMASEYFDQAETWIVRWVQADETAQLVAAAGDAEGKYIGEVERGYPECFKVLRGGGAIRYRRGADSALAPEVKSELEVGFARTGVCDILIMPIFLHGQWWGYVVSMREDERRRFSAADERVYRGVTRVIETLLERESQKERLADQSFLHSQIFEKVRIPVVMLDREQRIVAINDSLCDMLELSRAEMLGKRCDEGFCREKKSLPCNEAECPIVYSLTKGGEREVEFHLRGRIFRLLTQPILDLDGQIQYVLESAVEITTERAQQTSLEAQSEELSFINNHLRQYVAQDKTIAACLEIMVLEENFPVALSKIVQNIGPGLGADNCAVYQYQSDGEPRYCQRELWTAPDAAHDLAELPTVMEKDFAQVFAALKEGQAVHVILGEEKREIPWYREVAGYLTACHESEIILTPIMPNGKFWGYFGSERNGRSCSFGSAGMRMFEASSHMIEVLLERESQLRSIARAEQEKKMILDTLAIPIVLFDDKMRVLNLNQAARALFGAPKDQILAAPGCWAFCCCGDGRMVPADCLLQKTLRSGVGQHGERLLRGIPHMIHTVPIHESGRVGKVLQSMVDIREVYRNRLEMPMKSAAAPAQAERVLVVDDVMMNVKVLGAMLKKMGYEVRYALSAKEALAILDEYSPRWVLSDIWMPEMNGVELAQAVRAREDSSQTLLWAVTADAECRENFDMSCFEGVLIKPITGEKLKQVFQTHLDGTSPHL